MLCWKLSPTLYSTVAVGVQLSTLETDSSLLQAPPSPLQISSLSQDQLLAQDQGLSGQGGPGSPTLSLHLAGS